MELRDIEYFAVIAEHGNLARAAEALGLSQPALSKSLRPLENAVDAKLVRRTSKGVELTPEGAALHSRVRQLRLSLIDVTREISDLSHGREGHLRIGLGTGIAEYLLEAVLSGLLSDAPKLTLKITVGANDSLMLALRKGELDLIVSGISTIASPDLVQEHLYDDEFVVCVGQSPARQARIRNDRGSGAGTVGGPGGKHLVLARLASRLRGPWAGPAAFHHRGKLRITEIACGGPLRLVGLRFETPDAAICGEIAPDPNCRQGNELASARRRQLSKGGLRVTRARHMIDMLKSTARDIVTQQR